MRKTNFKKSKKTKDIKYIIVDHINNNFKDYMLLVLFFITGVLLGVIFINKLNNDQRLQSSKYITETLNSLKLDYQINNLKMLKSSILETVIGIPFIYGIICYKGFCIGYTCSTIVGIFGTQKGVIFILTSLLFQNIVFIPCMMALGVSGLKLSRSIIKDRRKENIKVEIYRHTIFCLIMFIGLLFSSVLEIYVSSNLFTYIINFLAVI